MFVAIQGIEGGGLEEPREELQLQDPLCRSPLGQHSPS